MTEPAAPIHVALNTVVANQRDRLLELLRGFGRVVVAFSGGVDSAVVAQAARLACGDAARAVTAISPSVRRADRADAARLAAQIGIAHEWLDTGEFADPQYRRNAPDRCYFCKSHLYGELEARIGLAPGEVLVNGANFDDRGDHRPGMRAAAEHAVRSPLLELEITKAGVRELAAHWGLPVWDKPASPCLSSRIAYGVEVTPERVARIDAAEEFLIELLDCRELRVRLDAHDHARLELPLAVLPQLADPARRPLIVDKLKALGFRGVSLDLEGFRSGSHNAVIAVEWREASGEWRAASGE